MGVPKQWVKNLTTVARVAVQAWLRSPTRRSGLKELTLRWLWYKVQLWLGFNPWPRNSYVPQVQPLKKLVKMVSFMLYIFYHYFKKIILIPFKLTIIGKTMAAGDALMTQSRTRQVSWMRVKRCTLRSGTCRR